MRRVLGLAAINRDLVCKVPHDVPDVENATDNLGQIVELEEHARRSATVCVECLGGSVINTVYVLAQCGMEVHVLGKVGGDQIGAFLLNKMAESRLRFIGRVVEGGPSGRTVVLSGPSTRQILVYPGVNDYLNVKDLDEALGRDYDLVHTSTFACVLSESPIEAQIALFREYTNAIRSLMFGSLYCKLLQIERTREKIVSLLQHCDVLFLNKDEAEKLFGDLDVHLIRKFVRKYNLHVVCITLGPDGVLAISENDVVRERSLATHVLDTTGAGDAFAGGFLLGILMNYDIHKCVMFGLAESAQCLQHYCGTEYSVKCEI